MLRLPRNAQLWAPAYFANRLRRALAQPTEDGPVDVLFCISDHYEPDHGGADDAVERRRVAAWVDNYPRLFGRFRDADGRPPQHTFFYPLERYRADHLDALAGLCRMGYGEVEVHLHHENDTSAALTDRLTAFRDMLHRTHGLLGTDSEGLVVYGFIHGDWALDNSNPDGGGCGVNDELTVLLKTGCYADFTMPSAPHPTQTRTVNSIYYAIDDRDRPKSHDVGIPVTVGGSVGANALLMVQGPLMLDWSRPKFAVLPALDNAAIDWSNPPRVSRLHLWVRAGISVVGRREWVFVKVHTHGAPERNAAVLLSSQMIELHEAIGRAFNDGRRFRLHYVTAREMANVIKAAESGQSGDAGRYRDYLYAPPPVRR